MMFVGILIMAYVLAHFIEYAGASTAKEGAEGGFWSWLGFIAPVTLGTVLWGGKSWKLWAINNGHYLVALLVMGAIIAGWK
ncbi:MAG: DUF1761 domain-containing protein [Candidatus Uhrbacteria bacterium]|nr:DUF1761 domain-containing protein [Candidatus Uhrbacteria bacterium]